VAIYEDRIEWGRSSWHAPGGATAAVLTSGMSLAFSGKRRDTNMIPIRQIQGVTTHRAGLRYTVVKVATAADTVEFHVSKPQAEAAKDPHYAADARGERSGSGRRSGSSGVCG
jgi:hypothetical protein